MSSPSHGQASQASKTSGFPTDPQLAHSSQAAQGVCKGRHSVIALLASTSVTSLLGVPPNMEGTWHRTLSTSIGARGADVGVAVLPFAAHKP